MAPVFLVTGATGHQGGATARILLKNNMTVHALVRDTSSEAARNLEKDGAILFKGDFDDVAAINAAITGVTGVFLNPPPYLSPPPKIPVNDSRNTQISPSKDPSIQVHQAQNVITAAIAAKSVTTLVVSTAFWTGDRKKWDNNDELRAYYNHKAAIEDAVRTAGFQNYTILRPSWLMHNYLRATSRYHAPELATEGVITHAYDAQTRIPHLDAADVGKFAAAALLDPAKFNGHEIELGFESLTAVEAARYLSEASGVHVEARKRSDDEIAALGNEIPSMRFQLWANVTDVYVDGEKLQKDYGIRLTSFAEYLQRERESLLSSLPAQK